VLGFGGDDTVTIINSERSIIIAGGGNDFVTRIGTDDTIACGDHCDGM
jgi:hypothetical protein